MSRTRTQSKSYRLGRLETQPLAEENMETQPLPEENTKTTDEQLQDEYYMNGYCKLANQDEIYAKLGNGAEIYAKDTYACKTIEIEGVPNRIEFPAVDEQGKEYYLMDSHNYVIYPINKDTNDPIFPINPETHEKEYISIGGHYRYPLTEFDGSAIPIYLKDSNGEKIIIKDEATGKPIYYVKNEKGDEVYPIDKHGNEKYICVDHLEMGATFREGGQYYAKNAAGHEYYPRMFGPLVKERKAKFLPPPYFYASTSSEEEADA